MSGFFHVFLYDVRLFFKKKNKLRRVYLIFTQNTIMMFTTFDVFLEKPLSYLKYKFLAVWQYY